MSKSRFILHILAVAAFMIAASAAAQAQATRTWVSGVGDDANPCSRTAPCKTFAGAISKTAIDGEIDALDPGGFGAVTITKSITIDGTGTFASVLASGTNGVNVNIAVGAADPLRQVRLRGLSINGAGSTSCSGTPCGTSTGIQGINVTGNGASAVHVEDTVIDGFTQNGINVNLTSTSNLILRNVTIRNCTGSGVSAVTTGTNVTGISFEHVNISSCGVGFSAANGTRGSIRASTFGPNTTGINTAQSTSSTEVNVDSSNFTGHVNAINLTAGVHVRIAKCLISQNVNAIGGIGSGGVVDSGGNNTIMGNTTNQAPNGSTFPPN
jgi:hypothetical protein